MSVTDIGMDLSLDSSEILYVWSINASTCKMNHAQYVYHRASTQ